MFKIVRVSGMATVQDLGRTQQLSQAIPRSGAMDFYSLALANTALGQSIHSAGLEVLGRLEMVCTQEACLMLASRCGVLKLNRNAVPAGQPVQTQLGDVLQLESSAASPWCLFAFHGGLDVPEVLGSRSTCLVGQFGGFAGRSLQSGDVLTCLPTQSFIGLPQRLALPHLKSALQTEGEPIERLRVVAGPEWHALSEQMQDLFLTQRHRVSAQASRMGYRLEGIALPDASKLASIRSSSVVPGVIQLPPSGHPIVLLADAQTTGGYPRIAAVIQADLWKFAHLPVGHALQFELVDIHLAQQAWRHCLRSIHTLQTFLGTL